MSMRHIEEIVESAFVVLGEIAHGSDSSFQVPSRWQWTWLDLLHLGVIKIWANHGISWWLQ